MEKDLKPQTTSQPSFEERRHQRHQTGGGGTWLDFTASDFRDPAESFPGERERDRPLIAGEDFRVLGDMYATFQGQLFPTMALEHDILPDRLLSAYLLLYPPKSSRSSEQMQQGDQVQEGPQGHATSQASAAEAEAGTEAVMQVEDSGCPAGPASQPEHHAEPMEMIDAAAAASETTPAEPEAEMPGPCRGPSGAACLTCPAEPVTKVFRHRCIFCTEATMTAVGASVRLHEELDIPDPGVDLRGLTPKRDIREEGCTIS